jgi:hypothetical protein
MANMDPTKLNRPLPRELVGKFFVFGDAVRLWGTQNPRFFEGTAVATEAAALLKRSAAILRDAAR